MGSDCPGICLAQHRAPGTSFSLRSDGKQKHENKGNTEGTEAQGIFHRDVFCLRTMILCTPWTGALVSVARIAIDSDLKSLALLPGWISAISASSARFFGYPVRC